MIATLRIPGRLPALNELMLDRGTRIRGKKQWCQTIAMLAATQRIPKFLAGAHVAIECVEPNRRRDPDNLASGAAKCAIDGLVNCGVLAGDGWSHVLSLTYSWRCDPDAPCVVVTLTGPPASGVDLAKSQGATRMAAGRRRASSGTKDFIQTAKRNGSDKAVQGGK